MSQSSSVSENSPDRCDIPFIPFNLSNVAQFDTFVVAIKELPTPQILEPDGELSTPAGHELSTEQPSPAVHSNMLKLMSDEAREGQWGPVEAILPACPPSATGGWTSTFCEQLRSSLQHVQKRDCTASPVRPPTKRLRHSPPPPPPPPPPSPTKPKVTSPAIRKPSA